MTSVRQLEDLVRPAQPLTSSAPVERVYANNARREAPRARQAAWAVLLLAVFCVAMEVTCRLDDRIAYGVPLSSRVRSLDDLLTFDADGWHGRPNARYRKWSMNELGMRGPSASAQKEAGSLRVVVVGASEAFGLYESPHREFPRQMEDSLNASLVRGRCPGVRHFEVLNAALAGMSLPTIQHDVLTRIRRLRPDFILYYPTPTQYLDAEPPHTSPPPTVRDLSADAMLRPRIVARLRDQVKLLMPAVVQDYIRRRLLRAELSDRPAGWRFTSLPQDRMDLFERDVRTLVGDIREVGAVPVLATHANAFGSSIDQTTLTSWERFYPRASGSVILQFEKRSRDMLRRVATDSSVAIVDVAAQLDAASAGSFSDFAHFTDLGSSRVANAMRNVILDANSSDGFCDSPVAVAPRE